MKAKFLVLVIFSAISISASAQFWKKKKVEEVFPRYPELAQPEYFSALAISEAKTNMPGVDIVPFKRTVYSIELAEDMVMKDAKHNMRFRIYDLASYNFSDLASLYVLQNRFSEAKWYLLQSNELSRQQNDDKHTIANLLLLADIKLTIGETALAKLDLLEAHNLANAKGLIIDTAIIDKKMHDLEFNKAVSPKVELRYAEAVEAGNKAQ